MNYKKILKLLNTPQRPKVIAVTGQMASGKNFICSKLEKEGWKSIDCDLIVHDAINKAKDKILENFSEEAAKNHINLLNEDGTINRRELGKLLFPNPELLKKQEQIVHPVVVTMVKDFIAKNERTIINATVLYKTPELLDLCDFIIFVKAPAIKRFFRAKKRDKMPVKQIIKRFKTQKNLLNDYKSTGKDIKILNN